MGEPDTSADKHNWDRGLRYNSSKLDLNPTKPILSGKWLIPEETRLIQGKMEGTTRFACRRSREKNQLGHQGSLLGTTRSLIYIRRINLRTGRRFGADWCFEQAACQVVDLLGARFRPCGLWLAASELDLSYVPSILLVLWLVSTACSQSIGWQEGSDGSSECTVT